MSRSSLIWRKFSIDFKDIVDNIGCLKGMWHSEYDPTMEENRLFGETMRGIFYETFMTKNQCPGLAEAKRNYDESTLKVWWMSPALLGEANLDKT